MKTRLPLLLAPLVALATGCAVENASSIEIFGLCGFPDDASSCVTTGKCDTIIANRPFAFVAAMGLDGSGPYRNAFDLYIQVNNQLPNNADPELFRVNTNDFTIEEYRLTFTSTPALPLSPYVYRVSHVVPADGSVTPLVRLIPPEIMNLIDAANPVFALGNGALVEVELKIFGHLQDGKEIETAPHVVPVEVYDDIAAVPVCQKAGDVPTAACPHNGQTGTFKCEAP